MVTHTQHKLVLHDVAVARAGMPLAAHLSFTLSSGELLFLQGANGGGKSTLLEVLAGLLPPYAGEITLDDAPLRRHPEYPHAITYIGHRIGLRSALTVRDNVAFWARLGQGEETIDAALEYFDLAPIADMPCRLLSAGWQQRVALTRLLTMGGFLWLLDEPTANLDEEGVSLLHSLVVTRLEQRGMVIMSSHAKIEESQHRILHLGHYKPLAEMVEE